MSNLNEQAIRKVDDKTVDDNSELLDTLFAQARADEPGLVDTNMTKIVLNTLPKRVIRAKKRSVLFDVVGLTLGIIAAYFFFDTNQIFASAVALIPESLPITVANLASFFIGSVVLACLAFWAGEKAIK